MVTDNEFKSQEAADAAALMEHAMKTGWSRERFLAACGTAIIASGHQKTPAPGKQTTCDRYPDRPILPVDKVMVDAPVVIRASLRHD